MSLLDEHKAERRARIGKAARQLVAERGYEGLTMRELAQKARVAVPTLYNLFGSKDAILVAELEANARQMAVELLRSDAGSVFARMMAAFDAGMKLVEESPEFYQACMQMFLTSVEMIEMRQQIEEGYIAMMAANLAAAKAAGQLADWADPPTVARHMFALYISAMIAWGVGETDLAGFRAAALSGLCHLAAGVARGAFARDVEAKIRSLTKLELRSPKRRAKEAP